MTSPPPCFLKVRDFNGDEVGCFDRDLEVLSVGRLQSTARLVLDVREKKTGICTPGGTGLTSPGVNRFWVGGRDAGRILLRPIEELQQR